VTLTAILPSLRRSIPDPLTTRLWPDHTLATTVDLLVGGVSMVQLAHLCGTPCVHTGDHLVQAVAGRASAHSDRTVVLARVVAVESSAVRLDADLPAGDVLWREARVLGRVSTAHASEFRLVDSVLGAAMLPADLVVGDLLAIPCAGLVTHRTLVHGAGS
jgi:hypothetical protein